MAPNKAFDPTVFLGDEGGQLTLSAGGTSDPVEDADLVSRDVSIQQGEVSVAGAADTGIGKQWGVELPGGGFEYGAASAHCDEHYTYPGSPLTATFSWTQDVTIEPK